jgi:CubicO group peptidase (beta-lactamase class C family)
MEAGNLSPNVVVPSDFTASLANYVERARAEWGNIGLAVGIVIGSDAVFVQGFGRKRHDEPDPVTVDTLFQIGSTTKAFAATALALLVKDGRVTWDDPIAHHIPAFTLKDPSLTPRLTIRDALAHRSGLGDTNFYPFMSVAPAIDPVAQLAFVDTAAPFRASFCYNNLLYAAAGAVVEQVTGTSWAAFLKRRLLVPLGMKRTHASFSDLWRQEAVAPVFFGESILREPTEAAANDGDIAFPHIWDPEGKPQITDWQCYDDAAAAGALVSSMADMTKWLSFNLTGEGTSGEKLLAPGLFADLFTTQNQAIDLIQYPFSEETYALGWRRALYGENIVLNHGGGIIGFPAWIAMMPERKIGVVILSNGSARAREALGTHKFGLHRTIALWAFDRLLGMPPRDWSTDLLDRALAAGAERKNLQASLDGAGAMPGKAEMLDRYEGTYRDIEGHSGPVRIVAEDGVLTLRFPGPGAYCAQLVSSGDHRFRLRSIARVDEILSASYPHVLFYADGVGTIVSFEALGAHFSKDGPGILEEHKP